MKVTVSQTGFSLAEVVIASFVSLIVVLVSATMIAQLYEEKRTC